MKLVAAEFDPEMGDSDLIKTGDKALYKLNIMLDKMMFSDENDVVFFIFSSAKVWSLIGLRTESKISWKNSD